MKKKDQDQDNHSDLLFAELTEEMRQDQVIQFLKKYQYYIIGGVLAFVAAFGGLLAYDSYQVSVRKGLASDIAQAQTLIGEGQDDAGVALLQDLSARTDFYGYQAGMMLAKRDLSNGDFEAARTRLSALATSTSLGSAYKELAEVYALMAASNDTLSDAESQRLNALASGNGAYAGMAKELQVAVLVQQGQIEQALKSIDLLLNDEDSSSQLKFRLGQLKEALGEG